MELQTALHPMKEELQVHQNLTAFSSSHSFASLHIHLCYSPSIGINAIRMVFEKENLVQNAHEVGEYLIAQLKELQKRNSHITEVRGRGLMVGAVLDIPHKEVRSKLIHEQHCFTGCAGTNILRILPPLVLTKENVDDFIGRSETVLKEV